MVFALVGLVAFWILDKTAEGEAYRATMKGSNFKASTTVKTLFIFEDFWGV